MNHWELQIWPHFFQAVAKGTKTAEWRRDRGFDEGDTILLQEWDPQTREYTGKARTVQVTNIVKGPVFGIPAGYCMMSIRLMSTAKEATP